MTLAQRLPWRYLATLLVTNLTTLFLPASAPLRVAGALLLIGLLPGLSWANWLLASSTPLLRWVIAAALSYTLTMLTSLLLHYLPGPIQTWQLLVILDILALIPILKYTKFGYAKDTFARINLMPSALVVILLLALFLRSANLHYSEFQGDESLAMIAAAEALEGHQDALFLRAKGPGEVLLPLALWRFTGTTNELSARLPFTLAALLAIVTVYLVGEQLGGQRVGWLAAGFFAFNGFSAAFGRIVQYQALVLWMSTLAFLLVWLWRQTQQYRFAILGGLCLGTGLLAHYDAILVAPAIAWLLISGPTTIDTRSPTVDAKPDILIRGYNSWPNISRQWTTILKSGLLFFAVFLLTALTFYLPYALDPRANRAGEYVGGRIGNELRNNLPEFFHFNVFYSSSYYIIVSTLLVFGLLIWLVWRSRWGRWWLSIFLAIGVVVVITKPDLLSWGTFNMSVLPFALLLAGAFIALPFGSYSQALIVWLAVPFLGYNFVVALGLTHIYTIIPTWSLLAALAWYMLFYIPHPRWGWLNHASNYLLALLLVLSTMFLWNAFVRHDKEYWQDYPDGNLPLFWTLYREPPQAGFFGFAHRTGWKAVGQKIITGQLAGDYGSNEEPDVTTWYTRGAPRACDPQPEFYFLADDLIDPVDFSTGIIDTNYQNIGRVTLPNQKQLRILQQTPTTLVLGDLDERSLADEFDQTATPDAFARSARGAVALDANFGDLVRLIGYSVDPRRAYPGGRIAVTLYWQALTPIPASYQIFTHLEGNIGPVAQNDGVPVCWTYPTDLWQPGQIIADQHAIPIPSDVVPGSYPLMVGLYLADSLARLDVLDGNGQPAGTSVTLTEIEIVPTYEILLH